MRRNDGVGLGCSRELPRTIEELKGKQDRTRELFADDGSGLNYSDVVPGVFFKATFCASDGMPT